MHLKIAVFHVFFGTFPPWFGLFIQSCKNNRHIKFFIISDNQRDNNYEDNVDFIYQTRKEFFRLVNNKLNIEVNFNDSYKLCDFKPVFGLLYHEYIRGFDYWGYCDNDLVLGKTIDFLSFSKISKYDIISTYRHFLSGPFCLFRNNNMMINIFRHISDYKKILESQKHYSMDEIIEKNDRNARTIWNGILFLAFCMSYFQKLKLGEIRYAFRWHLKKLHINNFPVDFSEVAWYFQKNGKLSCHFEELLISDRSLKRKGYKNYTILWKGDELTIGNNHTSIFGYHFLDMKNTKKWITNYEFESDSTYRFTDSEIMKTD